MRHLQLLPAQCAMISAHMWDLRGAAKVGMVTVYVPRPDEDYPEEGDVRTKGEGGEVDYVVDDFVELAKILNLH